MNQKKALGVLHLSTLMLSFNALFAKLISQRAVTIIGIRAFIAFAVLALFFLIRKRKIFVFSNKDWKWGIVMGLLLAIHFVSFFHSIQISTVAIGMLSLATVPIMTSLLESLEERVVPKKWDLIAGTLALVGVVLMIPEGGLESSSSNGLLWGLFSAFIFSLRNILSKGFARRYSGEEVMVVQLLVMGGLLLPFVWVDIPKISAQDIGYLVIMGVFTTAIAHTLLLKGLEKIQARTASIIWNLQPLYSILLAIFILNEVPDAFVILGGCLIISAVIGETVLVKTRSRSSDDLKNQMANSLE